MATRFVIFFIFLVLLAPISSKAQDEIAGIPFDEIPTEALEDADNFYQMCDGNIKYYRRYDCECWATKYLEVRLQEGPDFPRQSIISQIDSTCPNIEEAAGEAYTECGDYAELMPKGVPLGEFCECYANTYAEMRGNLKIALSTRARIELKSRAMGQCRQASESRF